MPKLTIKLHELFGRASEIPDVSDCYLIDIRDEHGGGPCKDRDDEEGLWPVPYAAREFDALQAARDWQAYGGSNDEDDDDDADYNGWIWDGKKKNSYFRIGCNTPSVRHPVTLTFQWGEGDPKVQGVEMLVHDAGTGVSEYCRKCRKQISAVPEDCSERRLRALSAAVGAADVDQITTHQKAVALWHSKSW